MTPRATIAHRGALGTFRALLGALALAGCSKGPPLPRARLDATKHDFGPLWVGEVVRHDFTVTNLGEQRLELSDVQSSCGCLVPKMSSKRLEPGEKGTITVELHAERGVGAIQKFLRVATTDPDHRWLAFELDAVVTALHVSDPPLVDLPDLVLGDPREVVARLAVADGTPLTYGEPTTDQEGFSAALLESGPAGATVAIRFSGSARPSRRQFQVIVPTSHPRVAEARIAVQAMVEGRLELRPNDLVDFGTFARADGARREIEVVRRSKSPLTHEPSAAIEYGVKRGEPPPKEAPPVTATLEPIEPGARWRLVLSIAPGSPGRGVLGRCVVRVEEPDEPPHTLTLTGRAGD